MTLPFLQAKGRGGAPAGSESSKESGNLGFSRASLNFHCICQSPSFPNKDSDPVIAGFGWQFKRLWGMVTQLNLAVVTPLCYP